jgi:hypothetical protein
MLQLVELIVVFKLHSFVHVLVAGHQILAILQASSIAEKHAGRSEQIVRGGVGPVHYARRFELLQLQQVTQLTHITFRFEYSAFKHTTRQIKLHVAGELTGNLSNLVLLEKRKRHDVVVSNQRS